MKKKKIDFSPLLDSQKKWIEKKVKELGSMVKIKKLYNKPDTLVDQYALHLAEQFHII